MTKIQIDIELGEHPANLVAESIEVTLKATASDALDSDDADAVFDLQRAYLEYRERHFRHKDDIFKHAYHWTDEQLREWGFEPKEHNKEKAKKE